MSDSAANDDETQIRALVHAQAARLSWTRDKAADWRGYADAFLEEAPMIPSSRPARAQTAGAFIERMKAMSAGSLRTFEEKALGDEIRIFGNVAVALVASETLENATEINRDVSGYLLVKTGERWVIAAQAWDKEKPDRPIPAALRSGR